MVVNALGEQCPIPVVKATRALREMRQPGELEVRVDNEIAVQNLQRMASGHHFPVESKRLGDKEFSVVITVTAPLSEEAAAPEEACAPCAVPQTDGTVVAVETATMGRGDDKLGAVLMKGFLYALVQLPTAPKTVLFYNGGAHLTTEGSESLEDLRALAARGTEILTCGTCLNFYGLQDKLAVGGVTNMYDIVERLDGAAKVIKP
jgi:selenium metabolism protein YedF